MMPWLHKVILENNIGSDRVLGFVFSGSALHHTSAEKWNKKYFTLSALNFLFAKGTFVSRKFSAERVRYIPYTILNKVK